MVSESRIVWSMRGRLLMSWTLTIIVTVFLGVIGFILLRDLSWQTLPDLVEVVFGGGLALLGAGVVVGFWLWALRITLASRRYGGAELELMNTPARLGGRLKGWIRAEATLASDQAVNLVLQCWGKRSGGADSGDDSWLRWDSETLFTAKDIEQGGGELSVHFDLRIPIEQLPTGMAEKRWEISWTLIMNIEPNTGYGPAFDIPVERSSEGALEAAESLTPSGQSSLNVRNLIVADSDGSSDDAISRTRPPNARVRVESQPEGGIKFIPPRSRGSTFVNIWCLVTLPLWVVFPILGLAELKGVESPPVIAYLIQLGLAFGAALFYNGLPMLGQAFVNQSFRLGPDGVVVKRLLRQKRFPAGHFTCSEAIGNSHGKWMVSLERPEKGIISGLVIAIVTSEAEARWLVAELSRALDNRDEE